MQVRGFLLNFGVYYATRAALGLAFEWRWVRAYHLLLHIYNCNVEQLSLSVADVKIEDHKRVYYELLMFQPRK